jgi:SAM-dependent methyltransferase
MLRHIVKAILPASARSRLRQAQERIRPLLYAGRSVECPCCGARYRAFLPHGRPQRPNARCPGCGAVERHRLLLLYLKRRTNLFRDALRLLHFAPEETLRRIFGALPNLRYITADYEQPADLRADICRLAIRHASVDVILCSHVLEHVADDRAAMRELFRVLTPGGWAILQVPLDPRREQTYEDPDVLGPEERRSNFGQEDHLRLYGRDFGARLESAGFLVEAVSYARSLPPEQAARFGLLLEEELYLCRRPA